MSVLKCVRYLMGKVVRIVKVLTTILGLGNIHLIRIKMKVSFLKMLDSRS